MKAFRLAIAISIFTCLCSWTPVFAQTMQLSEDQEESIKERCNIMIRDYQQYLNIM